VHTTIPFLKRVLAHPKFVRGECTTGFVEHFMAYES
jgi:pyruvate carboxylase